MFSPILPGKHVLHKNTCKNQCERKLQNTPRCHINGMHVELPQIKHLVLLFNKISNLYHFD